MFKHFTALALIGLLSTSAVASSDATLFVDQGSLYRTSGESIMTLDLRTGELEIVYRSGFQVSAFLETGINAARQPALGDSGLSFLQQYENQLTARDRRGKDEESIAGACSAQANAVAATAAAVEATCATGGAACSAAIDAFNEAVAEYQECIRVFYLVD